MVRHKEGRASVTGLPVSESPLREYLQVTVLAAHGREADAPGYTPSLLAVTVSSSS